MENGSMPWTNATGCNGQWHSKQEQYSQHFGDSVLTQTRGGGGRRGSHQRAVTGFLQLGHVSFEYTDKVMRSIAIIVRAMDLGGEQKGEEREREGGLKRENQGGSAIPTHRVVFRLQQLCGGASKLPYHIRTGVFVLIVTCDLPVRHTAISPRAWREREASRFAFSLKQTSVPPPRPSVNL